MILIYKHSPGVGAREVMFCLCGAYEEGGPLSVDIILTRDPKGASWSHDTGYGRRMRRKEEALFWRFLALGSIADCKHEWSRVRAI
ncbi:hypothetical protein CEB3_c17900 [Peptococcaceae bacterium CEB3]|nr:hypothetical protein CEB3_c17900 [Peptococcaceae bacterium CEB3]